MNTQRGISIARSVFVILSMTAMVFFSLGIPSYYEFLVKAISPQTLAALRSLDMSFSSYAIYHTWLVVLLAIGCCIAGIIIFWFKSDEWVALLVAFTLIGMGANAFQPLGLAARVIGTKTPVHFVMAMILASHLFTCYLLPDGKFPQKWMKYAGWFWFLWLLISVFWKSFPVNLFNWKSDEGWMVYLFSLLTALLSGIYALIYRYIHTDNIVKRQQLKWVIFSIAVAIVIAVGSDIFMEFFTRTKPSAGSLLVAKLIKQTISVLAQLSVPTAMVFSILRYRLWDIDILINRTLVYGALTAIVIGIYVMVVGTLGMAIQGRSSLLISVLATGLVAVLVQPLRERLQGGVNRLMYGERDDPITVLSRLGQQLETALAPDAVLPSLVGTIAQSLKLPYVAIETITDNRFESQPAIDPSSITASSPTIAYGNPQPDVIRWPLIYQSETIGQLLVAPRATGEALSPMDRHLLENVAHQAGMAVHAVGLTVDLQRSRQRLVTAREEERRRLRRDLHDGLGPNLASQGLKLAAIRQLLAKDPTSAIPLLNQVMSQNKSTVDEVRRLVYGLRPPALDELGLVAAIRDHVTGTDSNSSLRIEITGPVEGLPPLSAAVEVAAYRIVLEALTNVIRHAQAQRCAIRISLDQKDSNPTLQVEIEDDGRGMPVVYRAGVGLRSMCERAEEIGGTCVVESAVGSGTHIRVKVPLIVA